MGTSGLQPGHTEVVCGKSSLLGLVLSLCGICASLVSVRTELSCTHPAGTGKLLIVEENLYASGHTSVLC